jgi:hypothetical protein
MTKRKYDDCFATEDLSEKFITDNDENDNLIDDTETSKVAEVSSCREIYKAAMNFFAKFQ